MMSVRSEPSQLGAASAAAATGRYVRNAPPQAAASVAGVPSVTRHGELAPMVFAFCHGPDRTPFALAQEEVVVRDGPTPIHGIISKGLLNNLRAAGVPANRWHEYGHLIGGSPVHEDAVTLLQWARNCGVLTFGQSAECARRYVEGHYEQAAAGAETVCELWSAKEGQTASVWVVTVSNHDGAVEDRFVLNVARDHQAGVELQRTAKEMQAIERNHGDIGMARVYDHASVRTRYWGNDVDVIVTRNQWIAGDEVHLLAAQGEALPYYVVVERFLVARDEPTRIAALRGRRLTAAEQTKLEHDLALFQRVAFGDGTARVNVNEGDVMWDGATATVVAIS